MLVNLETDTNDVLDCVWSAVSEGRLEVESEAGVDGENDRDGGFESPRASAHSTHLLSRVLSPADGIKTRRETVVARLREQIRQIENRSPVWALPSAHETVLGDKSSAAGSPSGLPVEDGGVHPRNAHPATPSSSPLSEFATRSCSPRAGRTPAIVRRHLDVW